MRKITSWIAAVVICLSGQLVSAQATYDSYSEDWTHWIIGSTQAGFNFSCWFSDNDDEDDIKLTVTGKDSMGATVLTLTDQDDSVNGGLFVSINVATQGASWYSVVDIDIKVENITVSPIELMREDTLTVPDFSTSGHDISVGDIESWALNADEDRTNWQVDVTLGDRSGDIVEVQLQYTVDGGDTYSDLGLPYVWAHDEEAVGQIWPITTTMHITDEQDNTGCDQPDMEFHVRFQLKDSVSKAVLATSQHHTLYEEFHASR